MLSESHSIQHTMKALWMCGGTDPHILNLTLEGSEWSDNASAVLRIGWEAG